MITDLTFQGLLVFVLWPLLVGGTFYSVWRRRQQSIGLFATYLLLFTVNHWLQALIYILPWYQPSENPETVATGFWIASVGLIALTSSAVIVRPFLLQFHHMHMRRSLMDLPARRVLYTHAAPVDPRINDRLPTVYLVLGLFVLVFVSRVNLPTISAFISALGQLFTVGLMLAYWRIIQGQSAPLITAGVVLLTLAWPVYLIGAQGFLHFGLLTATSVLIFAMWHRRSPLAQTLLFAPLVGFLGLSLLVSYFSSRNEIRAIAWDPSIATTSRVEKSAYTLFDNLKTFDIYDPEHLEVIDVRFGQNYLIGRTVERFETRQVTPAYGETFWNAILMLIPRAIWPDKPVGLGGDNVVEHYSGFGLYRGTVQPGQAMEFYINFGEAGVIIGFIVYGLALVLIDARTAQHFRNQNWARFGAWTVGGLAMLQVENSMIAVLGAGVSGLLGVILFNYGLKIAYYVGLRSRPSMQVSQVHSSQEYASAEQNKYVQPGIRR